MVFSVQHVELPVRLIPERRWTDDELLRFCTENRDLRIERTAGGEIVMMSPTGSGTGFQNWELSGQLWLWVRQSGKGIGFDSNAGFTLPDGSMLNPDASWMSRSRWSALTPEQRKRFAPVCPQFVIELRSPSDSLAVLQRKMESWVANGAELAWLIDPESRRVEVYRPESPTLVLEDPSEVHGEGPVQGFILQMAPIWTEV